MLDVSSGRGTEGEVEALNYSSVLTIAVISSLLNNYCINILLR